jgi:DNA-binding NarL/FixJ family response regulator
MARKRNSRGNTKRERQTALGMLREGLSVEVIAKVTNLSRNEIENLRGTL